MAAPNPPAIQPVSLSTPSVGPTIILGGDATKPATSTPAMDILEQTVRDGKGKVNSEVLAVLRELQAENRQLLALILKWADRACELAERVAELERHTMPAAQVGGVRSSPPD